MQPSRKRIQNDSEDGLGSQENHGEDARNVCIEEIKNKQTEMNNTLEGINGLITKAKEWINDLEYRIVEITATEYIEKRMK